MRMTKLLAAAAIILTGMAARGEDWPRWMGSRGDGISKETGLLDKWPDKLKEVWRADKVGIGFSSPVAVDGKVYLLTLVNKQKDVLNCFDAATGKVLWTQSYDDGYKGDNPGTRGTPTIADGKIYTYGGNGQLVCRELADGKEVWFLNVLKECAAKNITWGLASSPLLYNNRVYVQAGNGGPMVIAADKATGKIVLQSEKGMCSYATIAIVDVGGAKQLIAFAGKAIYGMDPETLKTLWSHPWTTSWDVNAMTPLYRDGNLFLSSNYNHGCIMFKLSATGAEKVWENKNMKAHFQPMIMDGDVFYGNDQGTLKCMAWPTGDVKWSGPKELKLQNGGSIVRVGDKLISMGERGMLSLTRATPEKCDLISQVQLFEAQPIWATPTIYNGKLYVKGIDELVCLDISGK